ncbi:MAG: P22 phage major capsid protein family protein [Candidatus Adiutricales bacterium]
MADHTLLTPDEIAKEALRLLTNNLVMGGLVYRDYETEFPGMPKKGGIVDIRKPVKFKVAKTRVRSTKTITEQYIQLQVATQAHVSWNFYSVDLTLTIEQYSERYIRPAAAALANQIDADLLALYEDVPNQMNESSGMVTPHTFVVLGNTMQKLDEGAVPPDDRVIVLNPAAHWAMASALSNWNWKEGGEMALRKGFLGQIAGADIFMDQNVKLHTTGLYATDSAGASSNRIAVHTTADSVSGAGLPSGIGAAASQNQCILVNGINATSGSTALQKGDVFTITGCNTVNPMSGESLGTLRQFVVTSDVVGETESTDSDTVSVYFYPDMLNTGPYKTVDTIPAVAATILVVGAQNAGYPQNLAFHRNAFALCMVPIVVPDGVWSASATEDGISIRVVKQYDIDEDDEIIRMDILYGVKSIYPDMACRIWGAEQ